MNITITIPGLLELATAIQNYAIATESVAMGIFKQAGSMSQMAQTKAQWVDRQPNPTNEDIVISDDAPTPEKESLVAAETPAPAKRARRTKAEIEAAKTPADDEGAENKAAIDAKLDAMRAQPTAEAPTTPAEKTDLELREEIRGIYRKKVELDPSFKAQYPVILSEVNEGVAEKLDNLATDKLLALIEKLS